MATASPQQDNTSEAFSGNVTDDYDQDGEENEESRVESSNATSNSTRDRDKKIGHRRVDKSGIVSYKKRRSSIIHFLSNYFSLVISEPEQYNPFLSNYFYWLSEPEQYVAFLSNYFSSIISGPDQYVAFLSNYFSLVISEPEQYNPFLSNYFYWLSEPEQYVAFLSNYFSFVIRAGAVCCVFVKLLLIGYQSQSSMLRFRQITSHWLSEPEQYNPFFVKLLLIGYQSRSSMLRFCQITSHWLSEPEQYVAFLSNYFSLVIRARAVCCVFVKLLLIGYQSQSSMLRFRQITSHWLSEPEQYDAFLSNYFSLVIRDGAVNCYVFFF
ncbi:hypothetical protein RRG08_047320 [Elysia crispata]|uniref:Uncharacterized protein n=1 Tax=Elysia crispata TaxID=231223 RepID=A0AAE1B2Z9_9GAST|nr:hypothetical protein RRG08_047320 [Elysia crispata]